MRKKGDSKYSGQMLIEAMVALSILIVSVFSIFALISRAISLNRVVSDQYVASYLASEGIEVVKNMIDTNLKPPQCRAWNYGINQGTYEVAYNSAQLLSVSGSPLNFDENTGVYSYGGGTPTRFLRTVTIEHFGSPVVEMRVNARVSWKGRGGSQSVVDVEDHFYDWRAQSPSCGQQ